MTQLAGANIAADLVRGMSGTSTGLCSKDTLIPIKQLPQGKRLRAEQATYVDWLMTAGDIVNADMVNNATTAGSHRGRQSPASASAWHDSQN